MVLPSIICLGDERETVRASPPLMAAPSSSSPPAIAVLVHLHRPSAGSLILLSASFSQKNHPSAGSFIFLSSGHSPPPKSMAKPRRSEEEFDSNPADDSSDDEELAAVARTADLEDDDPSTEDDPAATDDDDAEVEDPDAGTQVGRWEKARYSMPLMASLSSSLLDQSSDNSGQIPGSIPNLSLSDDGARLRRRRLTPASSTPEQQPPPPPPPFSFTRSVVPDRRAQGLSYLHHDCNPRIITVMSSLQIYFSTRTLRRASLILGSLNAFHQPKLMHRLVFLGLSNTSIPNTLERPDSMRNRMPTALELSSWSYL